MANDASKILYDDRADIGKSELERIYQAIIWLGNVVVLPTFVRPDSKLPEEDQLFIRSRLAELAEGGHVQHWGLEALASRIERERWWPSTTAINTIDRATYAEINEMIDEGVERYRTDLLRGLGKPPGSMISGVSEFVRLRDTLWKLGMARFVSDDLILSSGPRLQALQFPLDRLSQAGSVVGPVSETVMKLHGVAGLSSLDLGEVRALSRHSVTAHKFIAEVADDVQKHSGTLRTDEALESLLESTARGRYERALGRALENSREATNVGSVSGFAVTIAGMILPPLNALSFAQPMMNWSPHGRDGKRLMVFLAQLKKRTTRAESRLRNS